MADHADDKNLERLELLWESDPSSRVYLQLADAYREAGRHEDAIRVLETGLEHRPRDPRGRVALARCRLDLADPVGAVELLEAVTRQDPSHVVANKLLLEAYLQTGEVDKAGERLNIYRLLNDRDPELDHLEYRLQGLRSQPAAAHDDELTPTERIKAIAAEAELDLPASLTATSKSSQLAEMSQESTTEGVESISLDAPSSLSLESADTPAFELKPAAADRSLGSDDETTEASPSQIFSLEQKASEAVAQVSSLMANDEPVVKLEPEAEISAPPSFTGGSDIFEMVGTASASSSEPAADESAGDSGDIFNLGAPRPAPSLDDLFGLSASAPRPAPSLDNLWGDAEIPPAEIAEKAPAPAADLNDLWADSPVAPAPEAEAQAAPEAEAQAASEIEEPAEPELVAPTESEAGLEDESSQPGFELEPELPDVALAEALETDETSETESAEASDVDREASESEVDEPLGTLEVATLDETDGAETASSTADVGESEVEGALELEQDFTAAEESHLEASDPSDDADVDGTTEDPAATVTLGELYLSQGHHDEAERIFRKVLEQQPDNSAAHGALARIAEQAEAAESEAAAEEADSDVVASESLASEALEEPPAFESASDEAAELVSTSTDSVLAAAPPVSDLSTLEIPAVDPNEPVADWGGDSTAASESGDEVLEQAASDDADEAPLAAPGEESVAEESPIDEPSIEEVIADEPPTEEVVAEELPIEDVEAEDVEAEDVEAEDVSNEEPIEPAAAESVEPSPEAETSGLGALGAAALGAGSLAATGAMAAGAAMVEALTSTSEQAEESAPEVVQEAAPEAEIDTPVSEPTDLAEPVSEVPAEVVAPAGQSTSPSGGSVVTASDLLAAKNVAGIVPEGLTAKKILVLDQYLQLLRTASRDHVR